MLNQEAEGKVLAGEEAEVVAGEEAEVVAGEEAKAFVAAKVVVIV